MGKRLKVFARAWLGRLRGLFHEMDHHHGKPAFLVRGWRAEQSARFAAQVKRHVLQHPALGGPKGEIDGDRAGLARVHCEMHLGAAAGGNVDWPILLLRTGAPQRASAQLAVEPG